MADETPIPEKKLTAKEKRFCEEYLIDLNATRSAIAAGYSQNSARQIGYENLTKPHIRAFIDQRLKEKTMKADEVMKLTSDLAKSSLNDFFTIRQIEHTPRIVQPLMQMLQEVEEEIKFEEEYAALAELNEKEMEKHKAMQQYRKRTLIKYRLELKRNPAATRIVDGPTVMIDSAELDLVKLVQAKEAGRIESISYTPDGRPKITMCKPDASLVSLARMHGLYIDKTELTGKDGAPLAKQVIIIGGKEIEF
jgi:phage terminase small subunit